MKRAVIFVVVLFILATIASVAGVPKNGNPLVKARALAYVRQTQEAQSAATPTTQAEPGTVYLPAISGVQQEQEVPGEPTELTEVVVPTITLDPNLVSPPKATFVNAAISGVNIKDIEKLVILDFVPVDNGSGQQSGSWSPPSGQITLDESVLANVPMCENLGPPAQSGQYTYDSGFDWMQATDTQKSGVHPGWDMGVSNGIFASPAKAMVFAFYYDTGAHKYGSTGTNVMVICKIPPGHDVEGYLVAGSGHLDSIADGLQVGDIVEAGQPLGVMGNTVGEGGYSTGAHLHYYTLLLQADGSYTFMNPADWSGIGTR